MSNDKSDNRGWTDTTDTASDGDKGWTDKSTDTSTSDDTKTPVSK